MALRAIASDPSQAMASAFADMQQHIAVAETAAVHAVAQNALKAGRQSIARGGFDQRWQNALQMKVFPPNGVALDPAALIFDRIPYAVVFETGARISGRPLLWLPIEANLPALGAGQKWTPRRYIARFGPLISVNRPGKKPLLYDKKRKKAVFVGLRSVEIRKRFDVEGAVRGAVSTFDKAYDANLIVE